METTNNNRPITIQSMDDLLKALIQELTHNDLPVFYIQSDTTIKNPFDGSQLRTLVITVNYYSGCPLLDMKDGFDAFLDVQRQFIDKFIKIFPNIYPEDLSKYYYLNQTQTHVFWSYNTEYYLTLQSTYFRVLYHQILKYLNIMETLYQLTENMLAHHFQERVGDAFNDLINYVIFPKLDRKIETYNFKNKSLDPIKASILIANILKESEPLRQCFTDAMIICRDNEQAILYLLNFDICSFKPDFIQEEIQRVLPPLMESSSEFPFGGIYAYNIKNNELIIYETFRSIE